MYLQCARWIANSLVLWHKGQMSWFGHLRDWNRPTTHKWFWIARHIKNLHFEGAHIFHIILSKSVFVEPMNWGLTVLRECHQEFSLNKEYDDARIQLYTCGCIVYGDVSLYSLLTAIQSIQIWCQSRTVWSDICVLPACVVKKGGGGRDTRRRGGERRRLSVAVELEHFSSQVELALQLESTTVTTM